MKKSFIFYVFLGITLFPFLKLQAKQSNCLEKKHSLNDSITITKRLSKRLFFNPSEETRPGVYWYFMDGNISKEGITKDLESMKRAGIGYVTFLEVNLEIPRGSINFMSDEWLDMFSHIVKESKRIGINITLGLGPGWAGSGGPWVTGEQSMQHLTASSVIVEKEGLQKIKLPVPEPRKPYFGEEIFTPELEMRWKKYYKDVAVLAFPTPKINQRIEDSDEKALYYRPPYSSKPMVKQYIPTFALYNLKADSTAFINKENIIDLTSLLKSDGTIEWTVPKGSWTIMRFGSRNNGAVTRPAPIPGMGMECDKFDTLAFKSHLNHFTDRIFKAIGYRQSHDQGGLKMLHIDSWEMGAQNWTFHFREEFKKRRGYDPQPFYPVYTGFIVQNREISERFLWDLRQTSQELIIENHAGFAKQYSHKFGLKLSIEPYDMNPTADLELGAIADMPMCEFWGNGYGFDTSYSTIEATSDAHLIGQPIVPAESFTSARDLWRMYPGVMKNQTDWAFASGINRLVFHTFQHQCLNDSLRPGMTMGVFGVHWDRNQTWWPMVIGYHQYIQRCQYLLQQGRTVADILYLTPEGAPHVFRAPLSALESEIASMPDRKGYNFDGCPPSLLYQATVINGSIVFPSGASYRILVLPDNKTMTPRLIEKISELIVSGATVVGTSPIKSPSLCGYPYCDTVIKEYVQKIWGNNRIPVRKVGKGKIINDEGETDNLYQPYQKTASLLSSMNVSPDFSSEINDIRYTHRTTKENEIYFVSNRSNHTVETKCIFRVQGKMPELWNPMDGSIHKLSGYSVADAGIMIPLHFEGNESYFIVFSDKSEITHENTHLAFSNCIPVDTLKGAWKVSFDSKWGGPKSTVFSQLSDWSKSEVEGIKYYSGIATYEQIFNFSKLEHHTHYYLDISKVQVMAHVWLNGKDMGIMWTKPYRLDITSALTVGNNTLRIEVANLWCNRLIGDEQYLNDGIHDKQWPEWLIKGESRKSARYTFTTYSRFKKDDTLFESGLIGPACILKSCF